MSLIEAMNSRALELGVPLSVQFDLTYRCNERCVHCYLDHDDHGEMPTTEIKNVLDQVADAGVFFLTFSGGEVLVRRDFFEIVTYARSLLFNVKVKTNGVLINRPAARRLADLGVEDVQLSVYSHLAEVHDSITKLPGSFARTLNAIVLLKSEGIKVTIANILMRQNIADSDGVHRLARELGIHYTLDPTITPMMDGDRSVLRHRISGADLEQVFRNSELVGNVEEFCAPPQPIDDDVRDGLPCSAGHTACYISPYGDVFPCVQFPLRCGNVRRQRFIDIWQNSPQLQEVRSIRGRDLTTCSSCSHLGSCTRCPGLAYLEGNMRGPSTADCEKSFRRTGIPSAQMIHGNPLRASSLVQIQPLQAL
jgi:radical SAM protein with 4Fe4S-binding SPASM domain